MRNVIYTIKREITSHKDARHSVVQTYNDINAWSRITLRQLKRYADKTNSDLIVIDYETEAILPDWLDPFQRIQWLKFDIVKHFIESNYEKMLYVDLDVYIRTNASNIFEECDLSKFNIGLDGAPHHMPRIRKFVDTDICHNCGVICGDRNVLELFHKHVPDKNEWCDLLGDNMDVNEQVIISSIIQKHNIPTNILEKKWNRPWAYQDDDSNFVHYYGAVGALLLHWLSRKMDKFEAINLNTITLQF